MQYKGVLSNCSVINVATGDVRKQQSIAIALDGTIAKIGPSDADFFASLPIGSAELLLDCQGGFVIPGLIDCHVRVTAFTGNFAVLERTSPSYVTACALRELEATLKRGITTIRDAGGADHGLARALQENICQGPRLLFCGKALSQTGGHGDQRAPGDFVKAFDCTCAGLGRICDGDAQVRKAARDEIRKGATHIKVMAGGGVASPTDRITSTQFSLMELKAIVEEAQAANIHLGRFSAFKLQR
ncbi:amidohydrolase [Seminavis robusta]|uniref:Amidohydrolase n=1 Tax=Seminavis robusta TaxID=568900 RepID=A0A9N8HL25_9STRA|nr:amidohydrolase [Seminavis robusta]|eukprot:Sro993_g228960.1 amidohydrolase (244) ;mRNA; f:37737-38468